MSTDLHARDILRTLPFQTGRDIWLESSGIPVAVTPGGTYVAATFQTSGMDFQVYVAGSERALPAQCEAGGADIFLRNYDAAGAEQWTRQLGTSGYDFPGNLALDATGVYFSGAVRGTPSTGAFVVELGKTQTLPADTRPAISWECVVNAASYAGGGVSPGEIVTIFGRAMGSQDPVKLRLADEGTLPTVLGETRVLVDGAAAPLLYASAGQVSAIVPNAVAANATAVVEVEYRGVRSEALTVPVAPARPGIFTIDGSGIGRGAIVNQDGTVNSPQNPASRDSVIAVYITGGGLTDPVSADGTVLGNVAPLTKQPVGSGLTIPRKRDRSRWRRCCSQAALLSRWPGCCR